jgi:integrase
MATNLLNDRKIKLAKPADKEFLLSDGRGLYLRIRPSGAKDWLFIYTFAGKRRKMGLGSLESASLAVARSEADKAQDSIAQQIDPQLNQQKLVAEQTAQRESIEAKKSRQTVKELFGSWEKRELISRKDKGAEVRRSFEKDLFPKLGTVAAEDITRTMVVSVLDTVVERGAPIVARNLLGDIRQMFGYAILRGIVEQDPTNRLKRDDFGKKVERERILTEAEIKSLPDKLVAARMAETSTSAIWIMLSTCSRVSEISKAAWNDVDLEGGKWLIPPENAKNTKAHTVYLSSFAVVQFQVLKALAGASPWVLPARWTDQHLCVKSLAKQIGDRQRGDKPPLECRSLNTHALELPGGKWTPHDLRRTAATMMGMLGVRPDVIEKCLNHVEQNKIIRIYQRQKLEAEQAEAWRLLGERLELLLRKDTKNVVVADFVKAA